MAANDYYSYGGQTHRPELDYNAPLPPVPHSSSQTPFDNADPYSGHPSPFPPHVYPSDPYHAQDSQPSLAAESPIYGHGGQDPFADTIPLKQQTSKPADERLAATSEAYNPGLEAGAGGNLNGSDPKRKKHGGFFSPKRKIPWFVYTMTLIQVSVFIAELVKNGILTKTPIEIHPQFNPMIGPNTWLLVNMGSRFVPCMRNTPGIQDTHPAPVFPCPNSTSSVLTDPSNQCSLSEVCGFSGVPNPTDSSTLDTIPRPNQWYRFITPIFLHAGLVHIGFNMLLQLLLGADMERAIGPIRFAIVYFSSGIFGFVLGGNFAPDGISSMGASGCLFGILALTLLDLLYTWKQRRAPWKDLAFIGLDVVISFVLGLLPGLDNFSHIGGFLMGLVLGISLLHSPAALRQRIDEDATPYDPMATSQQDTSDPKAGLLGFAKRPVGFFKGRKLLWWAWWLLRAGALIGVFIAFVVLLNNFYKYQNTCSWCKYLSCLPINDWCNQGNLTVTPITSPNGTSNRRDLWDVGLGLAGLPDMIPALL